MLPRLLVDTHILLRWFFEPKRLSKGQLRAMESAIGRGERLAFSAMTLLEIALLSGAEKLALRGSLDEFFHDLNSDPAFSLLPLTYEVALEAASAVHDAVIKGTTVGHTVLRVSDSVA